MKHTFSHKLLFLTLAASGLLVQTASGGLPVQTASALITIDSVTVGNAGNANDTTGYGGVGYDYGIGKYEVTLNQYTAFLNAVGATDTYGLYNTSMGTDLNSAGIARSGASGGYTYAVIGSGNRPVTYVSWYDSARFANWLGNGQQTGGQVAGNTETGAYTLTGNTGLIARNAGWTYSLPSENEWYKAAYHQPVSLGGDTDNYWLYPTRSNVPPNSRNGSASDANSANYNFDDSIANGFNDGYAVSGSTSSPTGNVLTDAGAFSLASSFYGTFDQGGNVFEWNDALIDDGEGGSSRGLRGGSWDFNEYFLRASIRFSGGPASELGNIGFRVAIVPEPSVAGLMMLGMALVAWKRK